MIGMGFERSAHARARLREWTSRARGASNGLFRRRRRASQQQPQPVQPQPVQPQQPVLQQPAVRPLGSTFTVTLYFDKPNRDVKAGISLGAAERAWDQPVRSRSLGGQGPVVAALPRMAASVVRLEDRR